MAWDGGRVGREGKVVLGVRREGRVGLGGLRV